MADSCKSLHLLSKTHFKVFFSIGEVYRNRSWYLCKNIKNMFSSSIPYKFSSEILKMQKINHDQLTLNLFLWFFRLWTYKFWFLRTSFNFWGLETESQSKLRFLDGVFHTCDKVRISERENSYNNHDHGNILYIREHYFVLKRIYFFKFFAYGRSSFNLWGLKTESQSKLRFNLIPLSPKYWQFPDVLYRLMQQSNSILILWI